MRYRNAWATGLACVVSLGLAAAAIGQEPPESEGNWFTRLFFHGTPRGWAHKEEKAHDKTEEKVIPIAAPVVSRAQAEADFLRRLEVCLKLQEIAFSSGDNDLMRRAEQLEQRARDAFDQRMSQSGSKVGDAKLLEGGR